MQAMRIKRLVPTYVLAIALAIGVASGGLIAASVMYLADRSSDVSAVTARDGTTQPVVRRPTDERSLGGQQGAHPGVPVHPD